MSGPPPRSPPASSAFGGPKVSANYIWQLRTGARNNPSLRHIEALAEYFGVPPTYFFDDDLAERVNVELDLVAHYATTDCVKSLYALEGYRLQPATAPGDDRASKEGGGTTG